MQIWQYLFGPIGQWIFLGVFILLLLSKALSQAKQVKGFLKGFQRFKAGIGPLGVEVELPTAQTEQNTQFTSCPFPQCKEEWKNTEKQILNTLETIDWHICSLRKDIGDTFIKLDELGIDQLKLVFYNKHMPDVERLISGLKYVSRGFNSQMKRDVIAEAETNIDVYKAAVVIVPKLRLEEIDKIIETRGQK